MPSKTAAEMQLLRLKARQHFIKKQSALKSEVNERLLKKDIDDVERVMQMQSKDISSGNSNQEPSSDMVTGISKDTLKEIEYRIQNKEVTDTVNCLVASAENLVTKLPIYNNNNNINNDDEEGNDNNEEIRKRGEGARRHRNSTKRLVMGGGDVMGAGIGTDGTGFNKLPKNTSDEGIPSDFILDSEELEARLAQLSESERTAIIHTITETELAEERRLASMTVYERIQEQRKALPIYKYKDKIKELVNSNQVIVLQGETGSGKTTQLLQYLHEWGHSEPLLSENNEQKQPSTTSLEKGSNNNNNEALSTTTPHLQTFIIPNSSSSTHPLPLIKRRRLICTQPRRIAATSVAARVADEMQVKLGSSVGYKVRFDDKTSDITDIIFMTDGMLLRELSADPTAWESISVIMCDECHERSLSTDVLLGLLREILPSKSKEQLRVILASATVDTEKFVSFFTISSDEVQQSVLSLFSELSESVLENRRRKSFAPHQIIPSSLGIEGRTFPVDIKYITKYEADYCKASAEAAMQIHVERPLPGDILIFLTGQETIERCSQMIKVFVKEMGNSLRPVIIRPIYANLPPETQRGIYDKTPPGSRKIVIATNIAETSITVDGIVYVIDCGLVKQNFFNSYSKIEELTEVTISQSAAIQRAGRAGRTQPGECIRLYTNFMYHNELPKQTIPEILRSNISLTILQLKALGVDDLLNFKLVDRPPPSAFIYALKQLIELGALNKTGELTALGHKMASFPMDPCMAKCLAVSGRYGCAAEMAIVAAVVSLEGSLFLRPVVPDLASQNNNKTNKLQTTGSRGRLAFFSVEEQKKLIMEARDKLYRGGTSDLFGYVMAFRAWLGNNCAYKWADQYFLDQKSLMRARDIYGQLLKIFDALQIPWRKGRGGREGGENSTQNNIINNKENNSETTVRVMPNISHYDENGRPTVPELSLPQLDRALTLCLCQGYFTQTARIDPLEIKSYIINNEAHFNPTKPRPHTSKEIIRENGHPMRGGDLGHHRFQRREEQERYVDIPMASYLWPSQEDVKRYKDKLNDVRNKNGGRDVDVSYKKGGGSKRPVLYPMVMFLQLRQSGEGKAFLYHCAVVPEPSMVWMAAESRS